MTLAAEFYRRAAERLVGIVFAVLLVALSGCSKPPAQLQLAGLSMGTSWHVTIVPAADTPVDTDLQRGIEAVLEDVNRSMSTYRPDSEISRLNATAPGIWVAISPEFHTVLAAALAVGRSSNGAYDITVAPLVDLWGFGPAGPVSSPPAAAAIAAQLQHVGQNFLELDAAGSRVLKRAELSLDFSSIAKGYAVDRVAEWLAAEGISRYLVEVGGEMRLAGLSARDDPWRVAIEKPDSADLSVDTAIRLTDVAVATSGDYRNYFEVDGKRYSHTIDPRTGYPVVHDLVSVTVIHPSAMIADAWATALIVVGAQQGMALAQSNDLAVYLIQRQGETYHSSQSPAFSQFLEADEP